MALALEGQKIEMHTPRDILVYCVIVVGVVSLPCSTDNDTTEIELFMMNVSKNI
jgi:hypothetical protein